MIKQFAGKVTAPKDMMAAARSSLEEFPGAFDDLMLQTGGKAPTADQLCAVVDGCRQAKVASQYKADQQYAAAMRAIQPVSSVIFGKFN